MATYLQLVNKAILESGVELDPLTSSNFASPNSQSMYSKLKEWVSDSWNEIQFTRDDYEFTTARATVFVYPAIYVENGDRASAPSDGTTYVGQDTAADFEVQQVITHSGTWLAGDAAATIYFKTASEQYKLNEFFDELLPTPATSVFQVKGRGRYNFVNDLQKTDISEIHYSTMYIQTTGGSTSQTNDASTEMVHLIQVPWAAWIHNFEQNLTFGMPQYFTVTPEGDMDFYPRPDQQYVLHFTYTQAEDTLTLYSDTPRSLPAKYHNMIAWKAVMKWALYDKQSTAFARAKKEFDFFNYRLEKNGMPTVSWGCSRYNADD